MMGMAGDFGAKAKRLLAEMFRLNILTYSLRFPCGLKLHHRPTVHLVASLSTRSALADPYPNKAQALVQIATQSSMCDI